MSETHSGAAVHVARTRARQLRTRLADQLRASGALADPAVERAFRVVPRHLFVAEDTSLEAAYDPDDAVAIKHDAQGVLVSSTSAPAIQAAMLEQARPRPGMRVLEIGSGGYNAALLAEVVGTSGQVVSVDIDPEVSERAVKLLRATGYRNRVKVLTADAEHPPAEIGSNFDVIMVTVAAWDIPPAWQRLLAQHGTLVVPLRMHGMTRSIAFRPEAEHLLGADVLPCSFVAMQGTGAHEEHALRLTDAKGNRVRLRFDGPVPEIPGLADGLCGTRASAWSGVRVEQDETFAELHLWLGAFLAGFCEFSAGSGTELAANRGGWFPYGQVREDAFAFLTVRPVDRHEEIELGAGAYGPGAETAVAEMVELIRVWDREIRDGPGPEFTFWPNGTRRGDSAEHQAVFGKRHGELVLSWPAGPT